MIYQNGTIEVLEAIKLASSLHDGQYRKNSSEPYIVHPISVAQWIELCWASFSAERYTLMSAAVLHDVVEDCDYPLDYIEDQFGPMVTSIVNDLTKLDRPHLNREQRHKADLEEFKTLPIRSVIVKMADITDNLKNWQDLKPQDYAELYRHEKENEITALIEAAVAAKNKEPSSVFMRHFMTTMDKLMSWQKRFLEAGE